MNISILVLFLALNACSLETNKKSSKRNRTENVDNKSSNIETETSQISNSEEPNKESEDKKNNPNENDQNENVVNAELVIGSLYLYVANANGRSIDSFSMNKDSGILTKINTISLNGTGGAVALGKSNKFLYAALRSTDSVAVFEINQKTGELSHIKDTNVGINPVYLLIDHSGKYLLMSSYSDNKVRSFAINADGTLNETPACDVDTQTNPHSIMTSKDNKFVFVPNTNSDVILQYNFTENNGAISPNSTPLIETPATEGPRHLVFHPTKNILYVVNEHADSVTRYKFDPVGGTLSREQNISTLPIGIDGAANTCADIEITPNGKFLYASNRGHDSIAMFSLDDNGAISIIDHQSTEARPREFTIGPQGLFSYVVGQDSNKMSVYKINQVNGKFEFIEQYDVGLAPLWVLIANIK